MGKAGVQGGDNAPPREMAAEIYADVARRHAPLVDVLILETMSSIDQARGALMGAGVAGKPMWLALSVNDNDRTRLRSNEALAEIGPLISEFAPERVLLNCSRPEAVSVGLPILAKLHPHVAPTPTGSPDRGRFKPSERTTDLSSKRHELGPAAFGAFAQHWERPGPRRSEAARGGHRPYRRAGQVSPIQRTISAPRGQLDHFGAQQPASLTRCFDLKVMPRSGLLEVFRCGPRRDDGGLRGGGPRWKT